MDTRIKELMDASPAPRITPQDIEANIASEHYFTAAEGAYGANLGIKYPLPTPLGLLTFCVLVLQNGFTVTGESACASPENFNEEIGRAVARQNAVNKIWPLMGYELRSKLAAAEKMAAMDHVDRMQVEYQELAGRLEKLDAFVGTTRFYNLDDHERAMLEEQQKVMNHYAIVLRARINRSRPTVNECSDQASGD